MSLGTEFGTSSPPRRLPGEPEAAYAARYRAWASSQGGAGLAVGLEVGLPGATLRFDATGGGAGAGAGAVLGAWPLASSSSLPAPTRGPGSFAPPVSGPQGLPWPGGAEALADLPFSPPDRMGGAVAEGLREPADLAPADLERERILAATGFDVAWGTPPEVAGLAWNPARWLYEPVPGPEGGVYRMATSGRGAPTYVQAYRDAATPSERWRARWVEAVAAAPDPARPYRVLSAAESGLLDATLARLRGETAAGAALREQVASAAARLDAAALARLSARTLPRRFDLTRYAYHKVPTYVPRGGVVEPGVEDAYFLLPRADLPADEQHAAWRDLCTLDLPPGLSRPKECAGLLFGRDAPDGVRGGAVGMPPPSGSLGSALERRPPPPAGTPGFKDTFETRQARRAHVSSTVAEVGVPGPSGDPGRDLKWMDAPPAVGACRVLIAVLLPRCGDIDFKEKAVVGAIQDLGEKQIGTRLAFQYTALARAAYYRRLGCTPVVKCYPSLAALTCDLAGDALVKEGKLLHLEIFGHGTGGQFNLEGVDARSQIEQLYEDFGIAAGRAMTGGEGQPQGHIAMICCTGGTPSTVGKSLAGVVSGSSGHVVFTPAEVYVTNARIRPDGTVAAPGTAPFTEGYAEGGWAVAEPLLSPERHGVREGTRNDGGVGAVDQLRDREYPGAILLPWSPEEIGPTDDTWDLSHDPHTDPRKKTRPEAGSLPADRRPRAEVRQLHGDQASKWKQRLKEYCRPKPSGTGG